MTTAASQVTKSCWILKQGPTGFIWVRDVRSAACVLETSLPELVLEQLEEAMAPVVPFERLRPGEATASGTYLPCKEEVPCVQ